MYACIAVYMGSSLSWGVGCSWSFMVRCFSLSVSLCQLCCMCGWVGGTFQMGKLVPEVAGIVLVTQPRDNKCQVLHCICQRIHFLSRHSMV